MNPLPFDSYDWDRETIAEQSASGRYNPAQVVVWNGHRHAIGAGTADDVDLFEADGALIVLARNHGLTYAGLEVWQDGERVADTFTDLEGPADELLQLDASEAAATLLDYCDY